MVFVEYLASLDECAVRLGSIVGEVGEVEAAVGDVQQRLDLRTLDFGVWLLFRVEPRSSSVSFWDQLSLWESLGCFH
jgi:hypothetical protein